MIVPISEDIIFVNAAKPNYGEFKTLRKAVMREHVERLGLPWNVWEEDDYHRELFAIKGLRIILYQKRRVGFVGVREEDGAIIIDRFCIEPRHQRKGIGTAVMRKIMDEPLCRGKNIKLDVLRKNPAIKLYERLGFIFLSEDDKLAYLQRRPQGESPQSTAGAPRI